MFIHHRNHNSGKLYLLIFRAGLYVFLFCFVIFGAGCVLFRHFSPRTPFIVPSVDAFSERAYVYEIAGWADEVAGISGIGATNLIRIPYSCYGTLEVWTTDKWIFGWKGTRRAVLHLPGNEALDIWGKEYFSKPEYHNLYIRLDSKSSDITERFNRGGSIMATPPLPGYPFGRLVISRELDVRIKNFFRKQKVQTGKDGNFLEIDTAWLKVGHVDELVNFLPVLDEGRFKLVVPAPLESLQIIKEVAKKIPGRAIFYTPGSKEVEGRVKRSGSRWIEVEGCEIPSEKWTYLRIWKGKGAGQVARVHKADKTRVIIEYVWDLRYGILSSENTEINKRSPSCQIALAIEGFCDEMPIWFDLPDETSRFLLVTGSRMWISESGEEIPAVMAIDELVDDVLLTRVNTEAAVRCRKIEAYLQNALGLKDSDVLHMPVLFVSAYEDISNVFALMPNNVNFQVFNREVICLRPCGPRIDLFDDNSDPFLQSTFRILASTGLNVHVLDGWDALHRNNGGARCGMNVWRAFSRTGISF